MRIRILSLAVGDLQAGKDFYEHQQPGLGAYFLEALLIHAGVHVRVFDYFRALSKRFPCAIYYRINGDEIEVWRVLDCRQNPKRISAALNGPQ